MLSSLLFTNPLAFLLVIIALVISISIHEFAHAFVADKLGDPTARYLGRVTLDPRAHLDPIGTIALIFVGMGWGRPVPFNPINLSNPKRDSALIALAGPASNFILATILAFIVRVTGGLSLLGGFLFLIIMYNLMLGFFNLLPFHPLDGFKIVHGLLPLKLAVQWEQIQPYGMYILLFLIFSRSFGSILGPFLAFSMRLLGLDFMNF